MTVATSNATDTDAASILAEAEGLVEASATVEEEGDEDTEEEGDEETEGVASYEALEAKLNKRADGMIASYKANQAKRLAKYVAARATRVQARLDEWALANAANIELVNPQAVQASIERQIADMEAKRDGMLAQLARLSALTAEVPVETN